MRSVFLAAMAALLFAAPVIAQEYVDDTPLEVEQDMPSMDWDLGDEGSYAPVSELGDSILYSHVSNLIACDISKGCDGHGDLQPLYPSELTVACNLEDNIVCDSVAWYELEDYIEQYQDAGIVLTQGTSEQIIIASN